MPSETRVGAETDDALRDAPTVISRLKIIIKLTNYLNAPDAQAWFLFLSRDKNVNSLFNVILKKKVGRTGQDRNGNDQ